MTQYSRRRYRLALTAQHLDKCKSKSSTTPAGAARLDRLCKRTVEGTDQAKDAAMTVIDEW